MLPYGRNWGVRVPSKKMQITEQMQLHSAGAVNPLRSTEPPVPSGHIQVARALEKGRRSGARGNAASLAGSTKDTLDPELKPDFPEGKHRRREFQTNEEGPMWDSLGRRPGVTKVQNLAQA